MIPTANINIDLTPEEQIRITIWLNKELQLSRVLNPEYKNTLNDIYRKLIGEDHTEWVRWKQ